MSDLHMNFGLQPHERPDDDEAREARHQVLATLLGAYADGELPPETASQIDAHLLGCAPCRREVELHTVVRARLASEPTPVASEAFRARVIDRIRNDSTPTATTSDGPERASRRSLLQIGGAVALVAALLSVGAARGVFSPGDPRSRAVVVRSGEIPMLSDVLDDYRRVVSSDLPGRARDLDAVRAAVPFPVQPLHVEGARLLAAWSTDLRGEPAAVLAYRWRDRLVLQYLVAEQVFFRHPAVRQPIAAGATIASGTGAPGVLAWAAPESGVVIVAELPPSELMALRVGEPGR